MSNTRFSPKRLDTALALALLQTRENVAVTVCKPKRSKKVNIPSNKVIIK